jgi:hypothetical protein
MWVKCEGCIDWPGRDLVPDELGHHIGVLLYRSAVESGHYCVASTHMLVFLLQHKGTLTEERRHDGSASSRVQNVRGRGDDGSDLLWV